MSEKESLSRNDEGCGQPPPMVRVALLVLLGHVEPGWDSCKWVVQMWLDGKLNELERELSGLNRSQATTTPAESTPAAPGAASSSETSADSRTASGVTGRRDGQSLVSDVDWLANVIRAASGDHLNPLGAGALAEKIVDAMRRSDSPMIEAKHVCGLQGFNPMIDGPCLACASQAIKPPSSDKNSAQKPVAWRYRYGKKGSWRFCDSHEDCNESPNYEIEPLYAAPSATPQPVRELLIEARAWLDVAADSGISSRDEMNLPTPNAERCHNLSTRIYNALMGIVRDSDSGTDK